VRSRRTLGVVKLSVVGVVLMLGLALLAVGSPVSAEIGGAAAEVDEVVAAVAELPELSVLTPEERDELQTSLRAALDAAIAEDLAAGVEPVLSVDAIVEAVQAAAAGGDIDVD